MKKTGIQGLIKSFNDAINGIVASIKAERNMKIHYFMAIIVIIASLFFNFSRTEFLILLLSISLVLVLELMNTAIEETIDMITEDYHPKAKIAKDVAAGAVLIAAVNSLMVGYLLFFDRLNNLAEITLLKIKRSPIHLTLIALMLVVLFTIGLKARYHRGRGTHLQGGTVSGHSAISFVMATIIAFLSENILVVTLSLGLAILVGESRIEGKIHTPVEVVLGAILGIVVGILVFQLLN